MKVPQTVRVRLDRFAHAFARVAAGVLGACAVALALPAAGQEYPNHPIRLIVPFAAGGGSDVLARLFAAKLATDLGAPMLVENRPGAGSLIGTRMVSQAPPDGYILLMQANTIVTNSLAYKAPGYRMADFVPIAGLTVSALALSVSTKLQLATLGEFIAYAKANPGRLNAASLGEATLSTIAYERFLALAGIKSVRINYGGSGPANQALASGVVDVHMDAVGTAIPMAKTGKSRILATTFDRRLAQIPDVPTFKEEGFASMTVPTWTALFAPAKTPDAAVNRVRQAVKRVLTQGDVRERVEQAGYQAWGGREEEFADFVAADVAQFQKDIARMGLSIEE